MSLDRSCLSVVVPIYNEQDNLPELHKRLTDLFEAAGFDACEAVLVSDGSRDDSESMIRELAATDARFKGVFLSRNFGHQPAVTVGLHMARGSVVAVLDGDLQDPPEVLLEMIGALERGADVAYGVRQQRKETAWLRLAYWLFYRSLRQIAEVDMPADAGDFCCMRRPVVDAMNRLPESRRFLRGLRCWVGYTQVGVPYARAGRHAGRPKYNLRRLMRLAYDGLFGFSDLPVKLMQVAGLAIAALAALVGLTYFALAFFVATPRGFPTLIISIWFLGGTQMLFLGILGEYLHRTFEQSLRRPAAIVREVVDGAHDGDAPEPQHELTAALGERR